MQIKVTRNTETNVTLAVNADQETLTKIKQATLRRFNTDSLKIPGFRGGKAPLELVEKHVDPQVLQSEFIDNALNHYYGQAVVKEQLRVAGQPKVDLKKFVPFTTMEFEVTVDVLGDVKLPNYKSVKKTKPTVTITASDVNEVLKNLQTRLAEKKDVERQSKSGDQVWIDFSGVDAKNEPVKGAEGKDYPLVLGSNTFIPGFEPELIGLKAGEEKTFTITFPADYSVKALQKKKVTFTVTIKRVQEVIEPKLDDAFAAKAGPFKDLKELKEDVKRQLILERQKTLDQEFENELLRELAKKTTVAIPKGVIEEQITRMEQDEKQNLAYRGQTWQEHLAEEGVSEEQHREQKRPQAEEQLKVGIMLGAIGDNEAIEVTPEEIEVRLQLLKGQYQDAGMQAELDKPEARQDIASRLRTEKIVDRLLEYTTGSKSKN